jgi:pantetheine-phosphate adenylyltransferase
VTQLAIYPGSFDPITLGHLSVLQRAAKVFDSVELLIVHNPSKKPTFSLSQRVGLARASLAEVDAPSNIKVSTLESGLQATSSMSSPCHRSTETSPGSRQFF